MHFDDLAGLQAVSVAVFQAGHGREIGEKAGAAGCRQSLAALSSPLQVEGHAVNDLVGLEGSTLDRFECAQHQYKK